jgi:hypothetical protein
MNWYLVKINFRIVCGNGNHKPQFDEQLRLISAATYSGAIEKAKQLAAEEEAASDSRVKWKPVAVTGVFPFSDFMDGAELFSAVTETDLADAYIHALQLKEAELQQPFYFQ